VPTPETGTMLPASHPQQERHGAVVLKTDLHVSAEHSRYHPTGLSPRLLHQVVVKRLLDTDVN